MKARTLQAQMVCIHQVRVTDDVAGELVCNDCGQVLAQNTVDFSFERQSNSLQNSRTGPRISMAMHDGGLSTVIDRFNRDSQGNPLSPKIRNDINRMRLWDSRSRTRSTSNRNLIVALTEIGKLKEKMSLSEAIVERSSYFYRKALEKNLVRGRTVKGVVGACVYAACRDFGTIRTIIEISECLQEKRSVVAKSYRVLFQKLGFEVSISDPVCSIIRFSNNLELSEKIKRDAILILDSLKERKIIAGKKPDAVATTVIYMACIKNNKNVSQQKISKMSGISGVTIRTRMNEFKKYISFS